MADLAAARPAQRLRLTRAERREVVVVQEALALDRGNVVDDLLVGAGAERDRAEDLGLSSCEQTAAVRARQEAHLARDGADGPGVAPIRPDTLVQDHGARQRLERAVEGLAHFLRRVRGRLAAGERRDRFAPQLRYRVLTRRLIGVQHRAAQALAHKLLQCGPQVLQRRRQGKLALGLAHGRDHALLQIDNGLQRLVAPSHRLEHRVLGQPRGPGFDHHHRVARAGHDEIQLAREELRLRGVDDVLPVDVAHAHAGHGALEGDVGDAERGRGAADGEGVRVVLLIGREDRGHHLHVVAEALGEERADGAVGQA